MAKGVIVAGWDTAPHLSDDSKRELAASFMPHELDARTKGIPSLGAGAIYPVPESEITIEPFQLPVWYKRFFALDVGWNRTAAAWFAYDSETDILYVTDEHYRGQAEPPIHAEAIKARGAWIPGVVDPAARGRSQHDGQQLFEVYKQLGLMLVPADNAVEAGIYDVWSRLSTGRLKVFRTCVNWFGEYRIYRRDEKGKIIAVDNHLMDVTRYGCRSGIAIAAMCPPEQWSSRPGFPKVLSTGRHESDYNPMAEAWKAGGGSAKR